MGRKGGGVRWNVKANVYYMEKDCLLVASNPDRVFCLYGLSVMDEGMKVNPAKLIMLYRDGDKGLHLTHFPCSWLIAEQNPDTQVVFS